jgi:hypothetical protein
LNLLERFGPDESQPDAAVIEQKSGGSEKEP